MAYMCIRSNRECDGCLECYPEPTCKHCGAVLTDDEFEQFEDECRDCHDYWFEENDDKEEDDE